MKFKAGDIVKCGAHMCKIVDVCLLDCWDSNYYYVFTRDCDGGESSLYTTSQADAAWEISISPRFSLGDVVRKFTKTFAYIQGDCGYRDKIIIDKSRFVISEVNYTIDGDVVYTVYNQKVGRFLTCDFNEDELVLDSSDYEEAFLGHEIIER